MVRSDEDEFEFAWLGEVADELGIDRAHIPPVTRRSLKIGTVQELSMLVWSKDEPEIVFLHGGGQNAHTWDLVALRLGRPAIAFDLSRARPFLLAHRRRLRPASATPPWSPWGSNSWPPCCRRRAGCRWAG